jgi:hypothetical protein
VDTLIIVEGVIEDIIFTNEANGYTVCEIVNSKRNVTLVGYMPFINEGETLKVTGTWVTHPSLQLHNPLHPYPCSVELSVSDGHQPLYL